jgi:hypothetical protein
MCKLYWVFTVAVAALDVGFAAYYSDTMSSWEANPFAGLLIRLNGPRAAISFRVATVAFFLAIVQFAEEKWKQGASIVCALVHGLLLVPYVVLFTGDAL